MAKRVGIPRCLLYYSYYPGWRTFFTELGAEVVLSEPTNKSVLDLGVKQAVDEICLPFKLFFGHVESLKDRVDLIFVPRMVSIAKGEWICPKFLGLPDMVKALQSDLPPLIAPNLNLRRSRLRGLYDAALEAAWPFTDQKWKVMQALFRALQVQRQYELQLKEGRTPMELLDGRTLPDPGSEPLSLLLLGHPYLIYESYINMDLIRRFREMGALMITPEMIPKRVVQRGARKQAKPLFWTLNKQVMGTAYHFLENGGIDGIVQLAAFGCGPDSLINELIERRARNTAKIPLLSVNVDEHSGEAGLVTRLEAFMDMVQLRRRSG